MSQASNISQKIDSILAQRKMKAEDIKKKRESLLEIKKLINSARALSVKANGISDEKVRADCKLKLAGADVPIDIRRNLDKTLNLYEAAIKRFERDSINIATVGLARQGKSVFLQSVSNLDNNIIPAYDAGDCTGAVSIISNDPSVPEGEVRVELTFRTRDEAVQIVRDYISAISADYLKENDITFDDIEYISIPQLESCITDGDASKSIKLEHLRKIVNDFNGTGDSLSEPIKNLYGHSPTILTDPEIIKKYVAQNNGLNENDPDRESYYSYLAVKKADIHCRFRDDVGKLVLVDTIGLGDTKVLGIEEAMLDTVDTQCDAAIVVRKPIAGIRVEDTNLYELLRKRFAKRDTSKWLFYLANHHKNVNDNAIDSYFNDVRQKNFSIAGSAKIDCSDKDEVQTSFLIPTLNTLTSNIELIDRDYLTEVEESFNAFKSSLTDFINKMPVISAGSGVSIATYEAGRECYLRLTADLSRQVTELYKKRDYPNATLWNRVKDILDNIESVLPDEETIQEVINSSGTLVGYDIWKVPLNYVRNKITDQFISINKPMEEETLEFKNNIVKELYNTLKGLNSNGNEAPPADGDVDYVKALYDIISPLIKDDPKYIQIYKGIHFLNEFEFNVRAELIREVRNQLSIINPMTVDYYMQPDFSFSKNDAGKEIKFFMCSRIAILEDNLRHALSRLNKLPNQAFYAAAEEFYDRLTFSSDIDGGNFLDMSHIWGQFFAQYGSVLFAEELEKYQQMSAIIAEYDNYRNELSYKLNQI